jgi:hypothetical protein
VLTVLVVVTAVGGGLDVVLVGVPVGVVVGVPVGVVVGVGVLVGVLDVVVELGALAPQSTVQVKVATEPLEGALIVT